MSWGLDKICITMQFCVGELGGGGASGGADGGDSGGGGGGGGDGGDSGGEDGGGTDGGGGAGKLDRLTTSPASTPSKGTAIP